MEITPLILSGGFYNTNFSLSPAFEASREGTGVARMQKSLTSTTLFFYLRHHIIILWGVRAKKGLGGVAWEPFVNMVHIISSSSKLALTLSSYLTIHPVRQVKNMNHT